MKDAELTQKADTANLLTGRLLRNYTMAEGLAEEVGYLHFAPVKLEVVEAILARRPWASEAVAKLLSAVVEDQGYHFFPLRAEWQWATSVRNDLAHSVGAIERDGRWRLEPRSPRYKLRTLPDVFSLEELEGWTKRVYNLSHEMTLHYHHVRDPGVDWRRTLGTYSG